MDILVPLLFMAVFYLGPAILKRYRAKESAQVAIPEQINNEMMNEPPKMQNEVSMDSDIELPAIMHVGNKQSASGGQSAWHGKLDPTIITNGVIFAEILQAPRAYRPFIKK